MTELITNMQAQAVSEFAQGKDVLVILPKKIYVALPLVFDYTSSVCRSGWLLKIQVDQWDKKVNNSLIVS